MRFASWFLNFVLLIIWLVLKVVFHWLSCEVGLFGCLESRFASFCLFGVLLVDVVSVDFPFFNKDGHCCQKFS